MKAKLNAPSAKWRGSDWGQAECHHEGVGQRADDEDRCHDDVAHEAEQAA